MESIGTTIRFVCRVQPHYKLIAAAYQPWLKCFTHNHLQNHSISIFFYESFIYSDIILYRLWHIFHKGKYILRFAAVLFHPRTYINLVPIFVTLNVTI